jgi:hypothetical protein
VWARRQYFAALGSAFEVRFQDDEGADLLSDLLEPLEVPPGRVRPSNTFYLTRHEGGYRLYRDCRRLVSNGLVARLLIRLLAEANRTIVEDCPYFAVHAAVVGRGNRVVAIPAHSGGGKSTLAAACLQAGWRYGSDEALILDDDGRVIPYPKPITLTTWSRTRLGLPARPDFEEETPYTAAAMGGELIGPGQVVTDIILHQIAEGGPRLELLPGSEGMRALLTLSFNHYRDGLRAFRLAGQIAHSATVWRLGGNDPVAAAALLSVRLS